MREIAALSLAHLRLVEVLQVNLLGDELFFGCCDISGRDEWGVLPCTLDRVGELIPIPSSEFAPSIDGYAWTEAALRESLMVIFGEAPPYAPERNFVGIYDRALKDWRVFRRGAAWSPVVTGYAPGSSHAISLDEGAQPQFELIDLTGSRTVGRVPTKQPAAPESIALNLALTHVAMALKEAVVCARLDGTVECSWPKSEHFFRLGFAGDDVVGQSRDAIIVHQRMGSAMRFCPPNMRPHSFDLVRRAALFWNLRSREFIELDLSSGRHLSSGLLPPGAWFGVDLRSRRIAGWTHEQRLLRVYELPP